MILRDLSGYPGWKYDVAKLEIWFYPNSRPRAFCMDSHGRVLRVAGG